MVDILINQMNISADMINKRKIFPTVPYFRRDTRELISAVRQGNIN